MEKYSGYSRFRIFAVDTSGKNIKKNKFKQSLSKLLHGETDLSPADTKKIVDGFSTAFFDVLDDMAIKGGWDKIPPGENSEIPISTLSKTFDFFKDEPEVLVEGIIDDWGEGLTRLFASINEEDFGISPFTKTPNPSLMGPGESEKYKGVAKEVIDFLVKKIDELLEGVIVPSSEETQEIPMEKILEEEKKYIEERRGKR